MVKTYVCFLWGQFRGYSPKHVNILARALKYWQDCRVICITDQTKGFCEDVEVVPMPKSAERVGQLPAPQGKQFPSSYRRLWLFSEEATEIADQVMLLDIDCLILGDLSEYWWDADFVGWRPMSIWGREDRIGGGTWLLKTGTHAHIWERFIRDPARLIEETRSLGWNGSDQAILSRFLKGCPVWPQLCGIYGSQDGVFEWDIPPKDARIVHFNGDGKPWNEQKLWMRAYCNHFGD